MWWRRPNLATERRSISYGAPSSRQVLLLVSVLALRQTEPLTLRLVTAQDVCRGGDRTIVYNLVNFKTGLPAAGTWWVTEHIQSDARTNAGGTNDKPNQYTDFITQFLSPNPYNVIQSFTISGSTSQNGSLPVLVNIGGQDFGKLGLWVSHNPLRNGQASPDIRNCPPQ